MTLATFRKKITHLAHSTTGRPSAGPAFWTGDAANYERRMIQLYLANLRAHAADPSAKDPAAPESPDAALPNQ